MEKGLLILQRAYHIMVKRSDDSQSCITNINLAIKKLQPLILNMLSYRDGTFCHYNMWVDSLSKQPQDLNFKSVEYTSILDLRRVNSFMYFL